MKKRKILESSREEEKLLSFNELSERLDENRRVYVLDLDGIERNKPNLDLYQRISEYCRIWVDSGPRSLGDVVDIVMAGATSITVRRDLWPELDISVIKEIAEVDLYVNLESERNLGISFSNEDKWVVFYGKTEIEGDFKTSAFVKNLCLKSKVYAYEPCSKNFDYWKTLGVEGVLTELRRFK
jgi:hypothetical protein